MFGGGGEGGFDDCAKGRIKRDGEKERENTSSNKTQPPFSFPPPPPAEIELSRAPDAAATAVWLDATGTHAVVALETGGRRETHYCHARWKRSRALAGPAGAAVTAAAFDGAAVTDTTTG